MRYVVYDKSGRFIDRVDNVTEVKIIDGCLIFTDITGAWIQGFGDGQWERFSRG